VHNLALADELRAVAEHGADAVYIGLADRLVSAAVQPGGRITAGDLAGYKAVEREPLCLVLRRATLCSFPPPSYGGVAGLEALGILERTPALAPSFLDLRFVPCRKWSGFYTPTCHGPAALARRPAKP